MSKQMRRNAFCFLFAMSTFLQMDAQVVMTTQLPPVGVTQKSQLWNLVVANASSSVVEVQIELSLLNLQTGQTVLTGTGRRLVLPKGAKVVQWGDVQPVVYNAAGSSGVDANPNGFLPVGNYKACYNLMRYVSDQKEVIAEECADIEIAPLSPPQLVLPADGDTLETLSPQFSWLPPAPATLFQKLSYELKVVEVLPGQSHGDAIQNNLPLLGIDRLTQPFYPYPASSKALEKGKQYLWQVTAKDINQYEGKTEVWLFSTRQEESVQTSPSTVYARLQRGNSGAVIPVQETLRIAYVNQGGDSTAAYQISASENDGQVITKGTFRLVGGENFLDLPLRSIRGLHAGGHYRFRLVSRQGEAWEVQFFLQ
jgi:hypothetical protein